jgi:hypothetical protein
VTSAGVGWSRVARGIELIGFGTFLLLTTQGRLSWSFWLDLIPYWPVLLVAIGIRLLFERSRVPWLVLMAPLLVIGTIVYVARREPAQSDAGTEWVQLRADRPSDLSAWSLEGRLALARLDVTSRQLPRGVLVEGRSTESGRGSVRIAEDSSAGRVRVTNSWSERSFVVFPGGRRSTCELGVATALPVAIDFEMAFTRTRLDVATSPLSRLEAEGAFNDVSLRLGEPSGEVHLDLQGAFNNVAIEVPPDTPFRVTSEGFLNLVDETRPKQGSNRSPGYRMRLHGAFNRVTVRSG